MPELTRTRAGELAADRTCPGPEADRSISAPTPSPAASPGPTSSRRASRFPRPISTHAKRRCSSTTPSTSNTRQARPARRKGATLSHHNILNNGFFVGEALRYTESDRICVPVPFYHCFGCVMGNLAAVTPRLPPSSFPQKRSTPRPRCARSRPTAARPSTACRRCSSRSSIIRAFASFRLDSLRTGIMAGAPCPIEVMRQVIDRMHVPEVTICYGMTETSPVSFQSAIDDPIELRVSTVGRVHPHLECKIVDPETGADRSARHARRAVHARLLRDAAATGTTPRRRPARSTQRAGCTPAIWP